MADICMRDIRKSFGSQTVLTGLTCRFPEGEVSCVTGPSGSGKTTMLRVLAGLEKADSGEITGLDGVRIGMVFQEDRLIGAMSAVDNVRLTVNPALPGNVLVKAFQKMRLEDSMKKPAGELSGGMARRVSLLRALLSDADVLLLDEPFKGLDQETRASVIRFTRNMLCGRTCVLVTHDEAEARMLGAKVHIII